MKFNFGRQCRGSRQVPIRDKNVGHLVILVFYPSAIIKSLPLRRSNRISTAVKTKRCFSDSGRRCYSLYQHSEVGYNYRMSNICAGIGRGQMEYWINIQS
jgi:dTDP-4-amino-4,6-dideoxygalactose transaminase